MRRPGRARAWVLVAVLAACVDGPGEPGPLGEVRVEPSYRAGYEPGSIGVTLDTAAVVVVRRSTGEPIVDGRVPYGGGPLAWVVDLRQEEESLGVTVELWSAGARLYAGDTTVLAQSGTVASSLTHNVSVAYVGPPVITTVTVAPTAASLDSLGATEQYTAEARDPVGDLLTGIAFSWASSDSAVATIDPATGLATATGHGTTTVSATAAGKTGAATLDVDLTATVDTVIVTPATPTLTAVDAEQQFAAEARDASGNPVPGVPFTWTSSDATVATIDGTSGLASAVGHGSATIRATTGSASGTAVLTVDLVATVDTVIVTPVAATLTVLGDTQFTAEARDAGGNPVPGVPFTWTSSDTAVATIDGGGRAAAARHGSTTITATTGAVSGSAVLTVDLVATVDTVIVTPAAATLNAVGATRLFTAEARDAGGNEVPGVPFTWTSSDATVATIDGASGLATAIGNGSATITSTTGLVAGTAELTVIVGSPGTTIITAAPDSVVADGGAAATIAVELRDANGDPLGASGGVVTLATTLGALTPATDHGDGTYTAELRSTMAGTAVVSGTLNGAAITDTAAVVFIAGPAAPGSSTITASPDTVAANNDDFALVTVRLLDAYGNPLTASGDTVTLATTLGTLTPVIDHGDGSYSAQLSSPTSGTAVISGTLNGAAIADAASVVFTPGAAAPDNSTVTASPDTVAADNDDFALVTVRLFDGNGNPLTTSGDTVTLATTLGTLTPVSDRGDGTYTAQLSSPTTGTAVVSGTLNGAAIADTAGVVFKAGPAAPNRAQVTASPDTVEANNDDFALVTVRLFDANGNPLTASGGAVTLFSRLGALTPVVDHGDGSYTAELRSVVAGIAVVGGSLNAILMTDTAGVVFTAGAAEPGSTTITASPTTVEANNDDFALVTVRLLDANGNPVTVSGGAVTLAATLGSLTPVTDHGDGTYTARLSSPTSGTAVVSGTLNGVAIADTAGVVFTAGAAVPGNATITAAPTEMEANNDVGSLITVRLFDSNGNPLTTSGGTVTLTTTLGTLSPVTNRGDGSYTAGLMSLVAGTAVVSGRLNGAAITDTAGVVFVPGPAAPHRAQITASPATVEANDGDFALVTVRLFDGFGNPVTTSGGTVALTTTLGTLTPVADHGDGTYTAQLSSAISGTAVVRGTLNGTAITDTAGVAFTAGAAAPGTTTITASPTTVEANNDDFALVTVRLFDANGNPVTTSGGTVTLATTLGALTSSVIDHGNGTYTAQVSSPTSGTAVVSGTLNGIAIADTAGIVFTAGSASRLTTTITADPVQMEAISDIASLITVRLFDDNGNPLTTSGGTVTLTTTLGFLSAVINHGDGTYTSELRSNVAGTATVSGRLNGVAITDTAVVVFVAPASAGGTADLSRPDETGAR